MPRPILDEQDGQCRTTSNPPREHSPITLRVDIALSYPPTSNMPAPVPTSGITAGSLAQPPNPAQPPAPGKAQVGGGVLHALNRDQGTEAAQARPEQREVGHQPQAQRFKTAVCLYRDVYGLGQVYKPGYRKFTALEDGHGTSKKHKLKPCENCVSFSLTQRQLFPKRGTQGS